MSRDIKSLGDKAGGLTEEAAAWTGLKPGTAVAIANVDAHVSVPAATVTEAGRMVIIMGTSNCHMVLGKEERIVPGMCGVVEDGIIPGFFGYEAGSPAWAITSPGSSRTACPAAYEEEAERAASASTNCWRKRRPAQKVGERGLLALDWWNGNRSVLVDVDLTGLLLGPRWRPSRRRSTARSSRPRPTARA